MTPLRAIVIHHDQPERCAETVAALHAQQVEVDVVIVDNASAPDAVEAVRRIDRARVVDAGGNLGFGGGANVGLRAWLADRDEGAGEWALVLPHDARPRPDCLRRMLDAVEGRDRVGLVSAEFGEDELPAIDKVFGALTAPADRGDGYVDAAYAHGTFLLLRRTCLREIGLFDESYFAYCEEADLSMRAANLGWSSGMVWGAVVDNPHQGSSPRLVDYLMVRNTIVFVARHFGIYNATVRFTMEALRVTWHAVVPARPRSPWFDGRARWLALRDVVLGRRGAPPVLLAAER